MAETTFHSITLPGANPARVPLTAVEFSTSTVYKVRDYCTYQGKLYICSTAHAAGAWNAAHFTEVNVGDEINTRLVVPPTTEPASTDRRVGDLWIDPNTESPVISVDPQPAAGSTNVPQSGGTFNLIKNLDNNKAGKSLLTGNFDATKPYSVNQLCIHDGYLYRCKVDIPTGTAWDGSKWEVTTIETELARIESEEVDLDVIAETFGDSNSYAVGDYVLHTENGADKLYRCISAVSDTSVWNSQYWSEVKLADEVNDLKSAFENYTDNIIGYPNLAGNIEIVENYYIPDSGTITAMNGFYYTSLIPVNSGNEYELYIMAGATTNPIRIHGYDSSGNWLVLILNQGIGNPDILRVLPFTVPTNVTQIRISTKIGKTIQNILPKGFRTITDQLETKIDSFITESVDFTNYDTGYIAADGSINYSGNWKHTKPISLRKDDIVSVTLFGFSGTPVILKDVSGFVPLVIPAESKNDTFTYTLTEDANIIINFTSTYDRSGTIQKSVNISNIEQEIQKLNDLCKIPYMSMLHKMGVLGDSLSSGEIWNGSTVRDCYNYSWLSNIARNINADCVHYSRGGMTAKEWWNDGGGYKTALADESAKPTAYYIAFGTNDKNQSEYPIGTISDVAGTDSFVGYMRSIIEYVHTQQQNAVIFLVSTYNKTSASEPYNEMIENISDLYSYCFFVNYADNGHVQTIQADVYVENSHFTTIGYVYVANVIKDLTETIIKNNLAWFKHFGLNNYAV